MTTTDTTRATPLQDAGAAWREKADAELVARGKRDDLIVQARERQGMGVREIARAVGMDPTQVSRILSRPR